MTAQLENRKAQFEIRETAIGRVEASFEFRISSFGDE